jgi:hypothetical protein
VIAQHVAGSMSSVAKCDAAFESRLIDRVQMWH